MRFCLQGAAICLLLSGVGVSQQRSLNNENDPPASLVMAVATPQRFLAVHGRQALLEGYAARGLEAWVYPVQIFRDYRVAFHLAGATSAIDGSTIIARIDYAPEAITRVYLGPGFIVREKLFVPLDRPSAILTYSVESRGPVEVEVHATPVLNLMWPAALGGQSMRWDPALSAFLLAESGNGFTALVGSPQIVAHDETNNSTIEGSGGQIGFTLRPDAGGSASVFMVLNPPHAADVGALFRSLIGDRRTLEQEAAEHYVSFRNRVVEVETPDERVNRAIAWAEIALDQAWVCNPQLGCGFVAGYGPSRGERRPQYAWFFAGDGLIAADGALAAGDTAKARDELAFILRYQDKKTGMIWHELSQSAGFIDWVDKYPYMYVHVDITFQFLGAVARYVAETGDLEFVNQYWSAIDAAYRYCLSLIDPKTNLPRIAAGKEGPNEQDKMSDDLGLSTSWVAASSGFASLAALAGHNPQATEAAEASQRARVAIPDRYWDATSSFWVSGYTVAGKPVLARRSRPSDALALNLFSAGENAHVLDALASSEFQTDWGTRGVGASSAEFDPESYAKGSVWPAGTAALARAFWSEHRPLTALGMWRTLVPLSTLDSVGHMDEVLDGAVYRPQIESVPEQTWSSAEFLAATINGLLGLELDKNAHRVVFAPHLPTGWDHLSISHVNVNGAPVSFKLERSSGMLTLHIDNSGAAFTLEFAPELPLGAKLRHSSFRDHPTTGKIEDFPQETVARIEVNVPSGSSDLEIAYAGGIAVETLRDRPRVGDPSTGIRVVNFILNGSHLQIDADVPTSRATHLKLLTPWGLTGAGEISVQQIGPETMDMTLSGAPGSRTTYRRVHAILEIHQ